MSSLCSLGRSCLFSELTFSAGNRSKLESHSHDKHLGIFVRDICCLALPLSPRKKQAKRLMGLLGFPCFSMPKLVHLKLKTTEVQQGQARGQGYLSLKHC